MAEECQSARTAGLVVEEIGDELLIYDLDTDEAHLLTPVAAAIFDARDGRASLEELADAASAKLGRRVSAAQAAAAVSQLTEIGLLEGAGVSRREAVRRAALAGAGAVVAVPLVHSIVAPDPALAESMCGPPGSPCTIQNFVTACCPDSDGAVGCAFPTGDPNDGVCFQP